MTILTYLAVFFLLLLIIIGGVYITIYEKAPLWERIQVFGVGFGMYIGTILLHVV